MEKFNVGDLVKFNYESGVATNWIGVVLSSGDRSRLRRVGLGGSVCYEIFFVKQNKITVTQVVMNADCLTLLSRYKGA